MDVLLISRCLPYPLHHGDRLILYHVVRALRARGHRFDLFGFYLNNDDLLQTPHFDEMFDHVEPIRERLRSRLDYLKRLIHPFPDAASGCWNPLMWEAVERRLDQKHYDMIHLFGGIQVYEYRNLIRGHPNIIVPYDSHALYAKRALDNAATLREKIRLNAESILIHGYEKRIFQGFGQTVLVSDTDAAYLRDLAPGLATTVIPLGVDTDYFTPVAAVKAPLLAFVGNYAYQPNLTAAMELVSEVLPDVRHVVPDAGAILIGPDPPDALASLAGNGVEVTGYVPDIRPYLATATCFVVPMRLGSGMKDKVLEAMAMRLPVVSTPLGCEGIAATDGDDVLLGQSAEELAKAVVRLFQDESLRKRIATGGEQLVRRRYTWQQAAAQYEALYGRVIADYHVR